MEKDEPRRGFCAKLDCEDDSLVALAKNWLLLVPEGAPLDEKCAEGKVLDILNESLSSACIVSNEQSKSFDGHGPCQRLVKLTFRKF